jgi:hypothetical protein
MENIKELRDELLKSFADLKAGKLKAKEAKELTNLAGKIIMSAKTQSDYNKQMNTPRVILFLDVPSEGEVKSKK